MLGDYLAASDNPLAIAMRLRRGGIALPSEPESLAAAIPQAGGKLVVLVHGLCMNDLQWTRKGHDHGAALARDLGYTPVYLHYNSGLHISTNGRAFAELLESLVAALAGAARRARDPRAQHGRAGGAQRLPLRRASRGHRLAAARSTSSSSSARRITARRSSAAATGWTCCSGASRYSAPLARLGKIRSAGITDLRFGNLLDEDWDRRDRFEHGGDLREPVPLPDGVGVLRDRRDHGQDGRRRAAGCSATGWCRWTARSAGTRSRSSRWHSPIRGSPTASTTSTC